MSMTEPGSGRDHSAGKEELASAPKVGVRVLGPDDAPAAATVLARAFEQELAKATLVPNAGARHSIFEMSVSARLHEAIRCGTLHGAEVDGELGAIALWYPPGASKLSVRSGARALLGLLPNLGAVTRALPNSARVLLTDVPGMIELVRRRRVAVARATRGITWHLDLLGTAPEHQRKGLARLLLERQLRRCDQDGAAAWLEATDPTNPPIYERFGFETVADIERPRWLGGYWVMRREPRVSLRLQAS
jgi:ribosomal protein S18 acetylase RimI-like enzyme